MPAGTRLSCAGSVTTILSEQISDEGNAVAYGQLRFRNVNSSAIYCWAAQILVGTSTVAYAVGDDVCPTTETSTKTVLGSGRLSAQSNAVTVQGYQGSEPCTDGQIEVLSGTLDVFVEDAASHCAGTDVGLVSSYDVFGTTETYAWTTSMTQLLTLPVAPSPERSMLHVFGSVEGTPQANPNTACGTEAATLVSQLMSNDLGVLATETDIIPASQGMGHVVIGTSALVAPTTALSAVSLWVGSNTGTTTVTTGGCCGDGKLAFVRMP